MDQACRLQVRNVNPQLGFETLGIDMISGQRVAALRGFFREANPRPSAPGLRGSVLQTDFPD